MTPRSIFANLVRDESGAYSTAYGPFMLQSALQPIFSAAPDGSLQIEALEGLVRASRDGEPVSPGEFFPLVDPSEMGDIDSIIRTIHILNTGRLNRNRARIFVKFRPGIVRTPNEMRHEVDRIRLAGHEAGLGPSRIVCEISEKSGADDGLIVAFIEHMRAIGFLIAIDDYGAGDADLLRLKRIKPDYVKFEPNWVRDFFENPAGTALLRVILGQMRDEGIEPIIQSLEEMWQVELCEQLGATLLQGYALARPELAPTTFDRIFPETSELAPRQSSYDAAQSGQRSAVSSSVTATSALARPMRAFGRRQSSGKT